MLVVERMRAAGAELCSLITGTGSFGLTAKVAGSSPPDVGLLRESSPGFEPPSWVSDGAS